MLASDTAGPMTATAVDVLRRFGLDTRRLSAERFKSVSNDAWKIAASNEPQIC